MRYNINNLSLEEKIGQLIVASLDGLAMDAEAKRFIEENHIGNFVHFGNNVRDPEQAKALNREIQQSVTARCGIPAMIAVDHEGGRVMRFRDGVTWFPSAMAIGATGDEALAEAVGRAMGEELRAIGFHMDMAPTLDVNTNPQNPVIGARSFGDDPQKVARFGAAAVRGMQSAGLMACGKHFPGHGDTAVDSHFGLPRVNKTIDELEQVEMVPFRAAIAEGLASMMTSHILYPKIEPREVPATMSHEILVGLLREKMGFEGLIISDAVHMEAIRTHYGMERGCVEAIKNGCDMICTGTGGAGFLASQASCVNAILEAVRSGELPMERVDDAVSRVLLAKEKHCQPYEGTANWSANAALARRAAERSVTWLCGGPIAGIGRVLCASMPAPAAFAGVEEGDWRTLSFAEMANQKLGGDILLLKNGANFSALDEADTVVVGVGKPGREKLEIRLLSEALRRGKNAVAVLTNLPYAQAELPEGCAALCVYGLVGPSVDAACRVLLGEIEAEGVTPVKL